MPSLEQEEALRAAEWGGLKKKLNAASWSEHMEDLMKAWGEKAAGLRWMHTNASGSWKGFSDRLALTGIVLTTLGSAAAFGGAGSEDNEAIMYGLGALGLTASLVQSLKKFYQADEKAAEHGAIAKQFGSFYRSMTLELGMSREDRRPADEMSAWAAKEYDRMQQEAPPLGGAVISEFKKVFKNADNIPDIAEDEFEIKIYGREEDDLENQHTH